MHHTCFVGRKMVHRQIEKHENNNNAIMVTEGIIKKGALLAAFDHINHHYVNLCRFGGERVRNSEWVFFPDRSFVVISAAEPSQPGGG